MYNTVAHRRISLKSFVFNNNNKFVPNVKWELSPSNKTLHESSLAWQF